MTGSEADDSQVEYAADLALVGAVLREQRGAVETFVEQMQCVPLILEARNVRCGAPFDEQELEDLVQETLATVWRRLEAYEGRSSLTTWCYGICLNQMKNALRRKRNRPRLAGENGDELFERPYDVDLEFDRFESMYRCLCLLDERPAAVIQLKFFEDLTFQQIGNRLSIPENSAKTYYYRGMQRMRLLMASGGNGAPPEDGDR